MMKAVLPSVCEKSSTVCVGCGHFFSIFRWRYTCEMCAALTCYTCTKLACTGLQGPVLQVCAVCIKAQLSGSSEGQLFEAIEGGRVAAVESLLEVGANPNARLQVGFEVQTALQVAIMRSGGEACVEALLRHGAHPELSCQFEGDCVPPLCLAAATASRRSVRSVELLLAYGSRINITCERSGNTALHVALKARNDVCWYLLLKQGASTSRRNASGESCAELASRQGLRDLALYLEAHEKVQPATPQFAHATETNLACTLPLRTGARHHVSAVAP